MVGTSDFGSLDSTVNDYNSQLIGIDRIWLGGLIGAIRGLLLKCCC